jgi:hypothetical protein
MDLKIYKLKKSQLTKKGTKNVYFFLVNNIKNSVFSIFGHDYFLDLLKFNYQETFYIKKNGQIVSYISYINKINESKMKKKLFFFILKNILFNLPLLIFHYKIFFKIHRPPNNYIQLIHLIIKIKKTEKKIRLKLHKKIENLNQKVVNKGYQGIYAIYENKNVIASKYYKKNNFKIFKKNIFFSFVKKKF